jgi:hypothetical protein
MNVKYFYLLRERREVGRHLPAQGVEPEILRLGNIFSAEVTVQDSSLCGLIASASSPGSLSVHHAHM